MKHFVGGLVAGFLVLWVFNAKEKKQETEIRVVESQVMLDAREKLQLISETEYEEYLTLQSAKEKYEKADEMLGKMMLILIADIGIRLSKTSSDAAKNSAEKKFQLPQCYAKPEKLKVHEVAERQDRIVEKKSSAIFDNEEIIPIKDTRKQREILEKHKRIRRKLQNICSHKLTGLLPKAKLYSQSMNSKTMKMNGKFKGEIFNEDGQKFRVKIESEFKRTGDGIKTKISMKLFAGDEVKYSFQQEGKNQNIKYINGFHRAVVFDFNKDFFFQVCNFRNNVILGVAYSADEKEIGVLSLKRIENKKI